MSGPENSGPSATITVKVKRRSRKGLPPSFGDTLGALAAALPTRAGKKAKKKGDLAKVRSKERTRSLNFRVTPKFRRAFKQAAAARDCKKIEFLEQLFVEWGAREAG